MRRFLGAAAAVLLFTGYLVAQQPAGKAPAGGLKLERPQPGAAQLKDQKDKVSYIMGYQQGRQLEQLAIDLNQQAFLKGLNDGLAGTKAALADEEIQQTMVAFQKELQTKMAQKMEAAAQKNKQEGAQFLAKNKPQPGVTETQSGLQYKVLKPGTGEKPKPSDTVKFHYRGTLLDGTEFDSSYERGEPLVFPVNQLIKGWQEALPMMPVGSKWEIWIPAELAYGTQGNEVIPPNATLKFEIELLGIEKSAGNQLPALNLNPSTGGKKQ